jgi:hypothetical protein
MSEQLAEVVPETGAIPEQANASVETSTALVVDRRMVEIKRLEIKANWMGSISDKGAYQLARMSIAYGLDPFLKELVILGDNVYPTVAALQRKANEDPDYEGEEIRPCNEQERKDFYYPEAPPEHEYLWICKVYHKKRKYAAIGYGRASGVNVKMSTMQIWLPEMAQKRARGRAYRIFFNISIPTIEEMYEFEDGSRMAKNQATQIQLATPEQLQMLEEKVLLKDYLEKGVVQRHEWDGIISKVQQKMLTYKNADAALEYFLGVGMDGETGTIKERLDRLQSVHS